MALHILKPGVPSWGNVIGTGIGEGVASLAETRLKRMKENDEIKLYTSLGVDPIAARLIQRQPAKQRGAALASILEHLDSQQNAEQIVGQGQAEEPMNQMSQPSGQQRPSLQNILGNQNNQTNQLSRSGISQQLFPEELRNALQSSQNPRQQEQEAQQNVQYEPREQTVQPGANLEQQKPKTPGGKHANLIAALRAGDPSAELARERARTAKQSAIDRQNKPFNEQLSKAKFNAEKTLDFLSNMEQLLETGKVASGLYGKIPYGLQNSESQQFANNGDELAQMLAGQSGVAGAYKIKFNQKLKPKLIDNKQTQRQRIQFLKKQAERILKKAAIKGEIIEENDGYQLPNMEELIDKRYNELEKSDKSETSFNALPSPALWFSEHGKAEIENEETGETLVSDGKQWIKV